MYPACMITVHDRKSRASQYATLEIRACSFTLVHPGREDQSIRIAVSTVTGRFMLKPDPTTTNYIFILVGSGFFFLAGM